MRAAPGLLAMIALITPLAAQESDDDAVADPARERSCESDVAPPNPRSRRTRQPDFR